MKIVLHFYQFENIISNEEIYKEWINIFKNINIELEILMNEKEKLNLLNPNSIFLKFMLTSKSSKQLKQFNNILNIEVNPSYVLFDNEFNNEKNGSLIVKKETLDNPFKINYAKNLEKNNEVNFQSYKGWKALFFNKNLPSNSLIINDSYIFDDKENKTGIGSKNLTELLDAILPIELNIPYHILINTSTSKNKTNSFYDEFIPKLIDNIIALRSYNIIVEVVIGEGFHKRKLFTNFLNVTTDKGFKIFDKRDHSKVLDHNDIIIETMFTRNDPTQGDSQFDEMKVRLKELGKLVKNSLDWINAETYNKTRCFYYSNLKQEGEIEIINRLIKSIK